MAVVFALLLAFSRPPEVLLATGAAILLGTLGLLHVFWLGRVDGAFRRTRSSLASRDREFRSVFDGTLDALMLIDDRLVCRLANPAAANLLGIGRKQMVGYSIARLVPGADRLLAEESDNRAGNIRRGRIELMRPDGARIEAEFSSPAVAPSGCHLLVLRDASALTRAEEARDRALAAARLRFIEAQVLRSATLTLTRNDPLNALLDRLLESLHAAVPYDSARVLLLESPGRLYSARHRFWAKQEGDSPQLTAMLDVDVFPVLAQALREELGVFIADAGSCGLPREFARGAWLGVPIRVDRETLGVLSLSHNRKDSFSEDHLRLARDLTAPVALAVSSARLRERAEIFRAELERYLSGLPAA